jgi:Fe-S oxidoreductase
MIEKPELASRIHGFLRRELGAVEQHLTCCRHDPDLVPQTEIINICPGCDRRYRELYRHVTTISLWEVLAGSVSFPFPDYRWAEMTILDACPTRNRPRVHEAVRTLLSRMRVSVVEPARTGTRSSCCGDTFFGRLPVEQVKVQMRRRAAEMPREDVVVYCVSCCKSMHIGGRRPRHIVDLLFEEETPPGTFEPDAWHAELDAFIASH